MLTTTFVPEAEAAIGDKACQELLDYLEDSCIIAIDTETTGLLRHKDHVVFWSMSDGQRRWCLDRSGLSFFKDFLEDPKRDLIFHNINFDRAMMLNSGVDVSRHDRKAFRCWDTMVMHTLIADNQEHGLKPLTKEFLGIKMKTFKQVFGKAAKEEDTGKLLQQWWEIDKNKVIEYASLDAWATFKIWEEFYDLLGEETFITGMNLLDYYLEFERPMHDVLWYMEREGAQVDTDFLETLIPEFEEHILGVETRLNQLAGKVINPNSHPQVRLFLYEHDEDDDTWRDESGAQPIKWTSGGASGIKMPSTDKEVLEYMSESLGSEKADLIIDHRLWTKILGTYLRGIHKLLDKNGRVHTTFKQHVARTGRLSSADPNLQNIPVRTKLGRQVRKAFIAALGKILVDSDYAQLEMRIAASVFQEEKMLSAIREGRDMHCWNAHIGSGIPYEKIKAAYDKKEAGEELTEEEEFLCELRTEYKTIGFGVMYGKTEHSLAKDLDITFEEAKEKVQGFFGGYKSLTRGFKETHDLAEEHAIAVTPMGRVRRLPEAQSPAFRTRKGGLRAAGNYPIQGHAAEITKKAQIRLFMDDELWDAGVRQIIQIHDEILAEIPIELKGDPWFEKRWMWHMEHPFGDDVDPLPGCKLESGLGYGPNWLDAK